MVSSEERPLRRSATRRRPTLARLLDVSVTGLRVELLVEPKVPAKGWLELVWSGGTARVEPCHVRMRESSGLVELGLDIVEMDEQFRDRLHDQVGKSRGTSSGLERIWHNAR